MKIPSIPPRHQRNRFRFNELHRAAAVGSAEETTALLSGGSFDIDQPDAQGWTPLVYACGMGHSHVARILLDKGASASIAGTDGGTAMHMAAERGELHVCMMLVNAGADPEAASDQGFTPLHVAAGEGRSEVVTGLIESGANPNCRTLDGSTPLFMAAKEGRLYAVRVLLRAKANPVLPSRGIEMPFVPLDIATKNNHSEVVRELLGQLGVKGCGGESRGLGALCVATMNQNLKTMALLTGAGVVDRGDALVVAAEYGTEASAKLLLKRGEGNASHRGPYVNYPDPCGRTPLLAAIGLTAEGVGLAAHISIRPSCPSPRIVRLLVDAGADTTSTFPVKDPEGNLVFHNKPLALATDMLREKREGGQDATEEQLNKLKLIRRLLLRVDAVYAVSWQWPENAPSIVPTARSRDRTNNTSTPLRAMLPLLRRRAARRGLPWATLFR